MLTYSGEVFVQFLEGPPDSVRRLMHRIQDDPRHRDMIILSEGADHDRVLPGWDLGLVAREEAHQVLRAALQRLHVAGAGDEHPFGRCLPAGRAQQGLTQGFPALAGAGRPAQPVLRDLRPRSDVCRLRACTPLPGSCARSDTPRAPSGEAPPPPPVRFSGARGTAAGR